MDAASSSIVNVALIGAGLFVRDKYVKIFRHLVAEKKSCVLKYIWSRSKESAEQVASMASDFAGSAAVLHGEEELEKIIRDANVHAAAVVLPAQVQPDVVLRLLRAGKHVIQEKPVAASLGPALELLSAYSSENETKKWPIWAVAENYRFESGLIYAAEVVREKMGRVMMAEVIVEAPMTPSNPYFSSQWRRDPEFVGAFLVDGGVHFIAGLRLVMGCEVTAVSGVSKHLQPALPGPDNLAATMEFANGAIGVLVMSYSCTSRKVSWRIVCERGSVEVDRGVESGRHGYFAHVAITGMPPESKFFPFSGVEDEIETFIDDVASAVAKGHDLSSSMSVGADRRSSAMEAVLDLAVISAMLRSAAAGGSREQVQQL